MAALIIGAARNPVQLIGVNVPFEPKIQFGRAFGPTEHAEERNKHGSNSQSSATRISANNHGINQPAPVREQTIWRSALSPELQRQLNLGVSGPQNSGRLQGNQFPQLESVNTNPVQHNAQTRNYHVSTAAHTSGAMQLRLVKG